MVAPSTYWDAIGPDKTFAHPLLLGEFAKYVSQTSPILDYGCGYGRTIRELHEGGFTNLVGVDYSAKMIERAKEGNPFARYEQNSGVEVPFPDESFDAILLLAVLTCIPDSGEQMGLFLELNRVLRTRGIIYISDCLINDDKRNIERYRRFEPKYGCYGVFELDDGAVMRHQSREHLENITSPFNRLVQEEFCVTTMNGHDARGIRLILQKPLPTPL